MSRPARSGLALRTIKVGRRALTATPVFDTYWRFAAKRQTLFMQRLAGNPPPWTDDPIVRAHRFTNAYRAADRVSQYLIKRVIYDGDQSPDEVVFRTLLFKIFNKVETWEALSNATGGVGWKSFELGRYSKALDAMFARGETLYSAAYIMPSPALGQARKHRNHLMLIEHMMRGGLVDRLRRAPSLEGVFDVLRSYPSLGHFLAFQFAIDLNYSEVVNFSEMDFVVAGPGARDGIHKCFADTGGLSEAEIIKVVTDSAEKEFERLGIHFQTLWGRPLQLIDCQNLFCELSKYARVAHPEVLGESGRTRIKQKFRPRSEHLPQWYPPKWKLVPRLSGLCRAAPADGVKQGRLGF